MFFTFRLQYPFIFVTYGTIAIQVECKSLHVCIISTVFLYLCAWAETSSLKFCSVSLHFNPTSFLQSFIAMDTNYIMLN